MPARHVEEVLALFETWGTEPYDEEVSQNDHARQTAALAEAAGAPDALVAAALLHDVGHLLELRSGGRRDGRVAVDLGHEGRGARWLSGIFPTEVTGPIAQHVAAKRYRCAVDPAYRASLSEGSERSLIRQGGPMSPPEVTRFESHPTHADAVELRGWDDAGKVQGLEVRALRDYEPLLRRLAGDAPA